MEILEKVLNPAIVWVLIPLLAVLLWGIMGIIRALRGEPEDFEEWKNELEQLHARVERLEQQQQLPSSTEGKVPANMPTGPYHGNS